MSKIGQLYLEPFYEDVFVARFWAHVDRSGGPDACWPWTGPLDKTERGKFNWHSRSERPHAVAWYLANGAWLRGREWCLHHHCEMRHCCNVRHMEVMTRSAHMSIHNGARWA